MKPRVAKRVQLFGESYRAVVERIGANVRRLREAKGWTQEECAYRCQDLGPALLRTIEAGRTNVTAATLVRLSDGLGVDIADLFVPTAPLPKRSRGRPSKTAGEKTPGPNRGRPRRNKKDAGNESAEVEPKRRVTRSK